jgi:hypothetical protein
MGIEDFTALSKDIGEIFEEIVESTGYDETVVAFATGCRKAYLALKKAGFTEDASLAIVIATIGRKGGK